MSQYSAAAQPLAHGVTPVVPLEPLLLTPVDPLLEPLDVEVVLVEPLALPLLEVLELVALPELDEVDPLVLPLAAVVAPPTQTSSWHFCPLAQSASFSQVTPFTPGEVQPARATIANAVAILIFMIIPQNFPETATAAPFGIGVTLAVVDGSLLGDMKYITTPAAIAAPPAMYAMFLSCAADFALS